MAITNSQIAIGRNNVVLATIQRYQFVIWLALALVRGVMFVYAVPLWQHPDEPTHFEHVRLIAQFDRLPGPTDVDLAIRKEIAQSMVDNKFWRDGTQPQLDDQSLSTPYNSPLGIYTISQPRLYYQVAAAWLKPLLGQPVEAQLHSARMLSVIFSMVIVLSAYLCSRWLFGADSHITIASCALIVFLPGFMDIMSAVNNDSLVNMLCALCILVLVWGFTHRINVLSGFVLVVLVSACLITAVATKATAVGLIVAMPLGLLTVLVVWALSSIKTPGKVQQSLLISGMVVLIVIVAGLLAIAANTGLHNINVEEWLSRYLRMSVTGTLQKLLIPQLPYDQVALTVFKSYFAVFGWRHIYIGEFWYVLLALVNIGVLIGLVFWIKGIRHQHTEMHKHLLMFVAFAVIAVICAWLAAILRSQADQGMPNLYHSHGRYAYIALVPSVILSAVGLVGWLTQKWRWRGTVALILTAVAFDAICFWGYLIPHYYIVPILGIG